MVEAAGGHGRIPPARVPNGEQQVRVWACGGAVRLVRIRDHVGSQATVGVRGEQGNRSVAALVAEGAQQVLVDQAQGFVGFVAGQRGDQPLAVGKPGTRSTPRRRAWTVAPDLTPTRRRSDCASPARDFPPRGRGTQARLPAVDWRSRSPTKRPATSVAAVRTSALSCREWRAASAGQLRCS